MLHFTTQLGHILVWVSSLATLVDFRYLCILKHWNSMTCVVEKQSESLLIFHGVHYVSPEQPSLIHYQWIFWKVWVTQLQQTALQTRSCQSHKSRGESCPWGRARKRESVFPSHLPCAITPGTRSNAARLRQHILHPKQTEPGISLANNLMLHREMLELCLLLFAAVVHRGFPVKSLSPAGCNWGWCSHCLG